VTAEEKVLARMGRNPSPLSLSEIAQGSGLDLVEALDALWVLEQQGKVEPRYWRLVEGER